jgi:hypothetical protein
LGLAHEIAHNLGAEHDRGNLNGLPGLTDCAYGGFYNINGEGVHTIMTQSRFSERIGYFSNPNVQLNGETLGTASPPEECADNVSAMKMAGPFVSGFRRRIFLNDAFVDRIPLKGYGFNLTGDLIDSTREENEPLHNPTTFHAKAGVTYQIAAASYLSNEAFVSFSISRPNDAFENPAILTGKQLIATSDSSKAGLESREPNHGAINDFFGSSSNSVWWQWMAPATGPVRLSTLGSLFGTNLGVYTGTALTNLELIAEDAYERGQPVAELTFTAEPDETYLIAVAGPGGFTESDWIVETTQDFETWTESARFTPSDLAAQLQGTPDQTQRFFRARSIP